MARPLLFNGCWAEMEPRLPPETAKPERLVPGRTHFVHPSEHLLLVPPSIVPASADASVWIDAVGRGGQTFGPLTFRVMAVKCEAARPSLSASPCPRRHRPAAGLGPLRDGLYRAPRTGACAKISSSSCAPSSLSAKSANRTVAIRLERFRQSLDRRHVLSYRSCRIFSRRTGIHFR
jgi:hypothetical protein